MDYEQQKDQVVEAVREVLSDLNASWSDKGVSDEELVKRFSDANEFFNAIADKALQSRRVLYSLSENAVKHRKNIVFPPETEVEDG